MRLAKEERQDDTYWRQQKSRVNGNWDDLLPGSIRIEYGVGRQWRKKICETHWQSLSIVERVVYIMKVNAQVIMWNEEIGRQVLPRCFPPQWIIVPFQPRRSFLLFLFHQEKLQRRICALVKVELLACTTTQLVWWIFNIFRWFLCSTTIAKTHVQKDPHASRNGACY